MRIVTLLMASLTLLASVAATADVDIEPGEYVVFYHHDVLGSPVTATNELGQVLWHERTESYGKSEGRVSQNGNAFGDNALPAANSRQGYTGHTLDNSAGLTYMKARYYDHNIGRFLSNDPVGYTFKNPTQSFNRYLYANNNPYKYTDPSGEFFFLAAAPYAVQALGYAAVATAGVLLGGAIYEQGIAPALNQDSDKPGTADDGEEDWEKDNEEWLAGNSDGSTKHGEKRKGERSVPEDAVREQGEKFYDNETGAVVYVDGKNVVIDGVEGNVTRWDDQTEEQTSKNVDTGKWDPIN